MTELAGGVLLDKNGRVLLLHRPSIDQWQLPGGKVDEGEAPAQTAIRELKEEIGVDVAIIKYIGEGEFSAGNKDYHYSWFLVEQINSHQTPKVLENAHDECRYFTLRQIKELKNASPNLLLLEKTLANSLK